MRLPQSGLVAMEALEVLWSRMHLRVSASCSFRILRVKLASIQFSLLQAWRRRSFWLWLHAWAMTSYWHIVVYEVFWYGCVEAWKRGDLACERATGGLAGTAQKIFGRRICWSDCVI